MENRSPASLMLNPERITAFCLYYREKRALIPCIFR